MAGSPGCDGFYDQGLQHLSIHIGELLDVEAAPAGGVLAELSQQLIGIAKPRHAIENGGGLTRRKTGQRGIALAPALVGVVVAARVRCKTMAMKPASAISGFAGWIDGKRGIRQRPGWGGPGGALCARFFAGV